MSTVFFVYSLTFANGKIYIGASRTSPRGSYTSRYRGHAAYANAGSDLPVHVAWREFGAPAITILSKHNNKEDSLKEEVNAIAKAKSYEEDVGYNIQGGGNGKSAMATPRYRELMTKKVWSKGEWKASISAAKSTPERKKAASDATRGRMSNGGATHLSKTLKGKSDNRSAETKEAQREIVRAFMNSEEGVAAAKRGYAAFAADPQNIANNRAALERWWGSDEHKEHCRRIAKKSAEKARKKVMDSATGIVYESQLAMSQALGVSDATISRRVKSGLVVRC